MFFCRFFHGIRNLTVDRRFMHRRCGITGMGIVRQGLEEKFFFQPF